MSITFCPDQYIICYIISLTLYGPKNRRSNVCLLSFRLSVYSVSFIFTNFTKMCWNQADLEGSFYFTRSVSCKGFSQAQVELNCLRKLSSPIFVHLYNITTEETKSLTLTSFSAVIFYASKDDDVFRFLYPNQARLLQFLGAVSAR